ncbi:septum site-determining protein MinC [Spirulina sp. CS-785/01]|uniref:septum site-determining protein MinC n=1 Tax=Spirulina sp. CS-785/01 TaxID=3021716 RepID=UPI00232BFB2D|nr:septum site-determining protein MinC [Spirulina sp. CS-785/01]MDB9315060.1 septum site-determining protein MinC [Spirulina sp. CS-785/01]
MTNNNPSTTPPDLNLPDLDLEELSEAFGEVNEEFSAKKETHPDQPAKTSPEGQKTGQSVVDQPSETAAKKSPENPTEKAAKPSVKKTPENPTEKAVEKPKETSPKQSTKKPQPSPVALRDSQLRLKSQGDEIHLLFPKAKQLSVKAHWSEMWAQLKHRLQAGERSWKMGTKAQLISRDQLLDSQQIKAIIQALKEVGLEVTTLQTQRRKTAVAAASCGLSVNQQTPTPQKPKESSLDAETSVSAEHWDAPLYLKSTLRSGMEIQHPGTVIVLGDVNPGSKVIAAGDIMVLGRLRGIAYAGAQGNRTCHIVALQMEAMQLRIADAIARPPERPPKVYHPEIAYVAESGIRLSQAVNFFKTHIFSMSRNCWVDKT